MKSAIEVVGDVTMRKSMSGISPPCTYVAMFDAIYKKDKRFSGFKRIPLTLMAFASSGRRSNDVPGVHSAVVYVYVVL